MMKYTYKKNRTKKIKITKYKNILVLLYVSISLIVFIISSYFIFKDFITYKENEQLTEELIEEIIEINPDTEENTIDWNNLKSINNDIIGWIEIEGTKINYPILQDSSKLYYLSHSYNKQYNSSGSIFTTNENPFIEDETVIYGHNMKNGSMFSSLGKYLDRDYLYSHQNFKIYTPSGNYKATIFSAYSIGLETENNNIKHLEFNDRIKYYRKASKNAIENIDDFGKIIKLCTCSYINANTSPTDQRYYIIASIMPISE